MWPSSRPVRPGARRFVGRSAAGLTALVVGAVAFALLTTLVTTRSPALLATDRRVADWLNEMVAGNSLLVSALRLLTDLGSGVASAVFLATTTLVLLVRRETRLAGYVAVTGLGAGVLSPGVKALVERLRPAVEPSVATATGPSFPSGHALGATVTYGVLLLVFLPAVPRRARRPLIALGVALVVTIGFTRLALGVHYLSDVLAGWLLGLGWLAVTTTAFRAWRRDRGLPPAPLPSRGVAPEAAPALEPAPEARRPVLARPRRRAAQLLVVWVLLLGSLLATGSLITEALPTPAFDTAVVRWLAAHRTPELTTLSTVGDRVGGIIAVTTLTLVSLVLATAVTRQWRPPLLIAVTMIGEVTLFLASARTVERDRPPVPHLDPPLPVTSSFPSGHLAAAICLYGALALLVVTRSRSGWRWPAVVVAVVAVLLVAYARLYRGVHYPTDLLGSMLLAVPWLLATWWALRPGRRARGDAGPGPGPAGRRRR